MTQGDRRAAAPERTRVLDAGLLIGAGIVAACQVGKAFIAMPLIISELKIGIDVASLILAVIALTGATLAMSLGIFMRRIGANRALLFGLVAMGAGSALGAAAPSAAILILSRLLEGFGVLATVLVIPALLQRAIAPKDRDLTLAIWGAYMPIGTAAMLLLGPLLPRIGWRALWAFDALLPIAYACLCVARFGFGERDLHGTTLLADVQALLRAKGPVYLALAFGLYSFSYAAIAGFMPLLLVSERGLSVAAAGLFVAAAVVANAVGNVAAGLLVRIGIPVWANILGGFAVYGLASLVIFTSGLPTGFVAAAAALTLGIAGLTPGSIFAAVPRFAPTPALMTPTIGLIQQASNIGQTIGPLATGFWAAHFGWPSVPFVLVPAACIGLTIALGLRNAATQISALRGSAG